MQVKNILAPEMQAFNKLGLIAKPNRHIPNNICNYVLYHNHHKLLKYWKSVKNYISPINLNKLSLPDELTFKRLDIYIYK